MGLLMKGKILALMLFAGMTTQVNAYNCTGVAQYSDGASYAAGAVVQNSGVAYRCNISGWCSIGGPYAPGNGWAWEQAWAGLGACDGQRSSAASQSSRSQATSSVAACVPTAITPYVRVNNAAWQQVSNIQVQPGDQVQFGPQPISGSWSWSGCGLGGNSRAQTFTLLASCNAVASYTNACGAVSNNTFVVSVANRSSSIASSSSSSRASSSAGLPAPWRNADVGTPLPGRASYDRGEFTTFANGTDIWGVNDNFHFVYQPLNGDGSVIARVTSVDATNPWAKAGVMIRENLNANSKNALMALTPNNGVNFQRRLTTGGTSTSTNQPGISVPYWVRVERTGAIVSGYVSTNGVQWNRIGSDTLAMASSVFVGLAHTSHADGVLGRAQYTDVSVQNGIVCFYENINFQGNYFCTSSTLANISAQLNEKISSVRLLGGHKVTIYENTNQGGISVILTADTPDLAIHGLDNAVSSYRLDGDTDVIPNLPAFCAAYPQATGARSAKVWYSNGRLQYATDAENNRIPDYSYAGYRYGEVPLPTIPVVSTLGPVSGDNTSRIQAALDVIGNRPLDSNGFRGALRLLPGTYEIRGVLRIDKSGVVLRGSGDGASATGNTILRATGNTPASRSVVILGSGVNRWPESNRTNITDSFVQVGSRSFTVASVAGYKVGDEVVIRHPSTQAWINAVDGGGGTTRVWTPGTKDIVYYRKIMAINANRITIDAPVFNHLNRSLSQSYMASTQNNAIREVGIENLRIDIVTAGGEDEAHAHNAVYVYGAHDSWVRDVTALHFTYAAVKLENAVRVTVEGVNALEPVGIRTGGRMYNFTADRGSQLILFKHNTATQGRHSYVTNGVQSASGNVFYRSSQRGGGSEAGHRHWATGMLYDNMTELTSGQILLINRGEAGSDPHGWSAAHSTVWQFNSEMVVQKPPTAQNYAISTMGSFRSRPYNPGPWGWLELIAGGGRMNPESLYEAQLCDRMENK